ncbi:MAG: hypothetical protein WCY09_09935 [Candidatus Omnitrophota bacterium]
MQLGYSSGIYAALGNSQQSAAMQTRELLRQLGATPVATVQAAPSAPASAPSGMTSSASTRSNGGLNILEQGIFETAKAAFTFPKNVSGAAKSSAGAQKTNTGTNTAASPGNGNLTFGEGAFPAATQAAFGGMGGSGTGIGYGGFAQGATITIGAPVINVPSQASAPSGVGGDYTGLILIAGVIMVSILIISMLYRRG